MSEQLRPDRQAFNALLLRFDSCVEQTEAAIRDLRAMQAAALPVMVKLRAKGKAKKLEEIAAGYAQLVAREMQLVEDLASNRARIEKLAGDIAEADRLEREMDEAV